MSRAKQFALSILISATLLYVAFKEISWDEVSQQLHALPLISILGFLAVQVVMYICRVWRWALLTNSFAHLPLKSHCRITAIGVACVIILPLRLGEFARPILLAEESNKPISSGIGATAVERTLDGLLVTFLFFASTAALPAGFSIPQPLQQGAWVSLVLFSSALIALLFFFRWQSLTLSLLETTLGRVMPSLATKIRTLLSAFHLGLNSLPNPSALVQILLSSFIFWLSQAAGVHFLITGLGWDLPAAAPLLITSVIVLAVMVPGGPAFLGTYQAGVLLSLSIFGSSPTDAMALGLVMYPIAIGFPVLLSIPFILNSRFSLTKLLPQQEP